MTTTGEFYTQLAEALVKQAKYFFPPQFPPEYVKERVQGALPHIPVFLMGDIAFITEVVDGEFYVEYIFAVGNNGGRSLKDVLRMYGAIGKMATALGFSTIKADAIPERLTSYQQLASKTEVAWKLSAFLSPVEEPQSGDPRTGIHLNIGSCRLDMMRTHYVVELLDIPVRDLSPIQTQQFAEEVVELTREAKSVVFFGHSLVVLEAARALREAGIPHSGMEEHYTLEISPDVIYRKAPIRRSLEGVFRHMKMIYGGKEYECGELFCDSG